MFCFQKTDVDFTMIDSMVAATQMTITRLSEKPGNFMKSLPDCFKKLEEFGVTLKPDQLEKFKTSIYLPYLDNVIENLHNRFPDNPVLEGLSLFDPDLLLADDPTHNEWIQHDKLKVHTTLSVFFTLCVVLICPCIFHIL